MTQLKQTYHKLSKDTNTLIRSVSSNPAHGEVYSIQHYKIKFVSDLRVTTSRWFSPNTPVSSTNKTERHDIAEILLKVALSTITLTLTLVEK
jgi:hypothetical protein